MGDLLFRSDKAVKPDKNTKIKKWHINALQSSLPLGVVTQLQGCTGLAKDY